MNYFDLISPFSLEKDWGTGAYPNMSTTGLPDLLPKRERE
jgi:hypothetical protein